MPEPPPARKAAAKPGKRLVHTPAGEPTFGRFAAPPIEWVLAACEALGDAAVAQVNTAQDPADLADDLFIRLQSCPDHEKLHQRLMEACEQAVLRPRKKRPVPVKDDADLDDTDDL